MIVGGRRGGGLTLPFTSSIVAQKQRSAITAREESDGMAVSDSWEDCMGERTSFDVSEPC